MSGCRHRGEQCCAGGTREACRKGRQGLALWGRHVLGNPRDYGVPRLSVLVDEEQAEDLPLACLAESCPQDRQETRFLVFE